MRDPRHDEFERLRQRAVELGNAGTGLAYRELLSLLASEFPIVRKAAASALDKLLGRERSLAGVCKVEILSAIAKEDGEQTLQFMLRAAAKCAKELNSLDLDLLRGIDRYGKPYCRHCLDERIRPDFYLPEFDIYIEYWGMNTPAYAENMRHRPILYQREGKRLVSPYPKDISDLDRILHQKLSRYIRL